VLIIRSQALKTIKEVPPKKESFYCLLTMKAMEKIVDFIGRDILYLQFSQFVKKYSPWTEFWDDN